MRSCKTVIGVEIQLKMKQHEAAGNKHCCGRYTAALKGINIWKE